MHPVASKKIINDFNFDAVLRTSAGIAAAYAASAANGGSHDETNVEVDQTSAANGGSHYETNVEVGKTSAERAVAVGNAAAGTVAFQSDPQDGGHHQHDLESADADALYALAVAGDYKKKGRVPVAVEGVEGSPKKLKITRSFKWPGVAPKRQPLKDQWEPDEGWASVSANASGSGLSEQQRAEVPTLPCVPHVPVQTPDGIDGFPNVGEVADGLDGFPNVGEVADDPDGFPNVGEVADEPDGAHALQSANSQDEAKTLGIENNTKSTKTSKTLKKPLNLHSTYTQLTLNLHSTSGRRLSGLRCDPSRLSGRRRGKDFGNRKQ